MLKFGDLQSIVPQLTDELKRHVNGADVWTAVAYPVRSYRELVEHVAKLSYANRNQLLFFRGQGRDYQSKARGSTLYPAIYRGDNLASADLRLRFEDLESAGRNLVTLLKDEKIVGARDVGRKKFVQWSILQHYEVVPTPLLDVTHSIRVACSFAQLSEGGPAAYVYVIGLPFPTNRISINSEDDIVNIRLLSICPPEALRPYFQEGYMAGTPDVLDDYDSKTELDFRNRLIAKFEIPRRKSFWNAGFGMTPESALYPSGDRVHELCRQISVQVTAQKTAIGGAGELLVGWAQLEERIVAYGRNLVQRTLSAREAIHLLALNKLIDKQTRERLDRARRVRNMVAHQPAGVSELAIERALTDLRLASVAIRGKLP